jgi:hypothetical protein
MLSDEELKGIAAQALNMAKRDAERGGFNFLLAAYNLGDTPPLHRMSQIEALIIKRLGEDWLNHGHTKDFGFKVLRTCIDMLPPDAVAFVTMCNGFSPTEKFHGLDPEEQRKLVDAGHKVHHQMVKDGLLTVCDVLSALAQTPERVCQYVQKLDEHGRLTGQPEVGFSPQENFDGRIKMFGKGKHAFSQ